MRSFMKSIILVRHATAIVRDNDLPDFDRTLIRKGKKESRKMAERFLKYQITPGIWISSPAPRALETAYIFADILEFPRNKILLEDALYNENSPEPYIELTKSLPNSKNSVIFFGHDPGISQCSNNLVKNLQLEFPKAGIGGISLLIDSWKKLEESEGYLTLIEFPGSRKGISRILERNLTDLISRQSQNLLFPFTPKMTRKMQKTVKSYSEKIAKEVTIYRKRNF